MKPTPLPDTDSDIPSLLTILLKIDKAIQDNDRREYVRTLSRHEDVTPLRQRCQIADAESFEDVLRISDSSTSNLPTIAVLQNRNLLPTTTPDIAIINQIDCNLEGVRVAQEQLRSAVRQYHRSFIDLSRLRQDYAETNDIFGQQLSKFVCVQKDQNTPPSKLASMQTSYYNIKKKIEDSVTAFLGRIQTLFGNIVRLQRIAIARRMGWGYLINNPNANFLIIVRNPLSLNNDANLVQIPDSWLMSNVENQNEERKKRDANAAANVTLPSTYYDNYLSPFTNHCVTEVSSLSELSFEMLKGQNFTLQIFALTENNLLLNQKIEDLKIIFFMWQRTSKGWFTSYYWSNQFNSVEQSFLLLTQKMSNPKCNNIKMKLDLMNELIVAVELALNQGLNWYYSTGHVTTNILLNIKAITQKVEKCILN